jgi:Leucine-rich repeat (LRR) protein
VSVGENLALLIGVINYPPAPAFILTSILQGIREIRGLDQCMCLEKLWVVEGEVRAIRGLSALTRLKELYLYSNHITTMDNLSQLTNLEV